MINAKHKSIRLTDDELASIIKAFDFCFTKEDHLWIFGSRVNPDAKGGDIDLYIETTCVDAEIVLQRRLKYARILLIGLYPEEKSDYGEDIKDIGDRKIDMIINMGGNQLPIYKIAKTEGIQLR